MPALEAISPVDSPLEPQSGDVSADIRAEIADHLATAAAALSAAGAEGDVAQRQAAERFGDVRRIARKCWWIQQGDQVMRRIAIVIGCITAVALVASLFVPALAQLQRLGDSLDQLSEELAALRADQQSLSQRKPPRYEISGRAYLGDPSKPAPRVEIDVWDLDAGKVVRRAVTDAHGNFASGPLSPAIYSVVAPLVGTGNFDVPVPDRIVRETVGETGETPMRPFFAVQSEPVYVGDGQPPPEVLLDVRMAGGQIVFLTEQLGKSLPKRLDLHDFKSAVALHVQLSVKPLSMNVIPYHFQSPPPGKWPLVGFRAGWLRDLVLSGGDLADLREVRYARFCVPDIAPGAAGQFDVAAHPRSRLARPVLPSNAHWMTLPEAVLPPGEYQVGVALLPELDESGASQEDQSRLRQDDLLNHLKSAAWTVQNGEAPPQTQITVSVKEGQRTAIRIVVPADFANLLAAVQAELARPIPPGPAGVTAEQQEQFESWVQVFRPRPLKIEVADAQTR
ncbi:MAG: hypothetical protein DCC68_12850 [Planctomycetota bacterium]|nr:MAG: hypothetical protein DCC68_12850 [Planctomycetota bacterium]